MSDQQREESLLRGIRVAKRLIAAREAAENLLPFMRLTMPDPDDLDDVNKTLYEITPQAQILCEIMEKVERRELKRVAVSIGPQMGKSLVISRGFPAWANGRNPRINLMLGSYNQDFANEFGADVREIINSSAFKQVFPEYELRTGGAAKDLLINVQGGKSAFVGVGGSGTGKPADIFVVDDPIRNDDDAQSEVYRERLWNWFNKVATTRCHGDSAIVIVHTRWHEDDLIGRLCDPDHPERNKRYAGISDRWKYINLPAVVEDPDLARALGLKLQPQTDPFVVQQFGTKPISSIWPKRKPLSFLAEVRQQDRRAFEALNMGRPAPEDGDYFTKDMIVEYHRHELPTDLRVYGASDHAVSTKQNADFTVLGCIGIDRNDDIWVLPDLVVDRMETDRTVEELLGQFKRNKPLLWWMENELISKSFGPFLKKRMMETSTYTALAPVTPAKDKKTRARAIQGRMQMRKVRFPAFAPWWPGARAQLLKFPYGTNDDFVDWCAHIGAGLLQEIAMSPTKAANDAVVQTGSIQWILAQSRRQARDKKREAAQSGW